MAQQLAAPNELVFGNLRVNLDTYGVSISDTQVDLTFYEFELLRLLAQAADRVLQYDALCQEVWHTAGAKVRRRLNVTIHRLRAKLEASWPYRVETVRRRGYGLLKASGEEAAS
jgi:DNA-binding response OmpR family regulator